MKISVIFGTRPEAIKLAPVIHALNEEENLDCHVCVTAQHRHMLDQVLADFGIRPDTDLDLMHPGQSLGDISSRAIAAVDRYLDEEKPDLVLVQGDTVTVFCATLAAFFHHIPVGHVEAGLRTGNLQAPWPEEANRVLTSRIASLHFAPTRIARDNLLSEGVTESAIHVTGNPVIDALLLALAKIHREPPPIPELGEAFLTADAPMVLITGHRRENFGEGFESICRAISDMALRFPNTQFVYPVHLNPKVREPVLRILGLKGSEAASYEGQLGNVRLIEPISYLPFVRLMERATLILTDSGGVQEEAPSLGKPVLVMRETTERPEGVDAGTVRLVGTNRAGIVKETARLLEDPSARARMSRVENPYGDGKAAPRIVDVCRRFLLKT